MKGVEGRPKIAEKYAEYGVINVTTTTPYLKDRISEALGKLQVPRRYNSVWIGPFEQLAGAGHSLIMSENLGFSNRTYSNTYFLDVQRRIVSLLDEIEKGTAGSDQDALRQLDVALLLQLRNPARRLCSRAPDCDIRRH